MKTAVVFPGQGAQYVGMGEAFFRESSKAQNILQECQQGSELDLENLIKKGPEEALAQTEITQPAIYATSLAIYSSLEIIPDYFAGFSLGQYSALAASGVFSPAQGARLLRLRGKFMQEAASSGRMAAILGLDLMTIKEIVASISDYVAIANINCPGQIVLSGTEEGIDKAIQRAKEKGAKKAVLLKVSGAFHSKLMNNAKERLSRELEKESFRQAKIPVISNETAREIEDIKESLLIQLTNPVLWHESILYLKQKGVTRFIEVGPGRVLSGLIKKTDRSLEVINIEQPQDLAKLR